MRFVAIIPARGGSKGIPGKNKRRLGGIPLIARTIRAAQGAARIDGIYVSTDDADIAAISQRWGAEVINRPAAIAGDTASSESAILHALEAIEAVGGNAVEGFVFLQCTSPFTTAADIDNVIAPVAAGEVDCAFTAVEDHGFLWALSDDGCGAGINHDHTRPRQRRQDMAPQYRETGAAYAIRTEPFRARQQRFCGPSRPVPIDGPSLEIDTPHDWTIAEAIARQSGGTTAPPSEDLAAIRAIITDFDGVHTDDTVIVDEDGKESVRCSRSDGMGIELLRKAGYRLLVLSKEKNRVVARRAEKLAMEVIHGTDDKCEVLARWLDENALGWDEIAFVGNDINDVDCMRRARLAFCPADGHASARMVADVITREPGGQGAIRGIAEMFLNLPDNA